MSGSSVRRHTIEPRKVHRSDQRGHLTLKYRREFGGAKKSESVIRIDGDARDSQPSESVAERGADSDGSSEEGCEQQESKDLALTGFLPGEGEEELEVGCEQEDEDEEEDLDDEVALFRELEKIKRERADKERDKKNNEIKLMMQVNPLLEEGGRGSEGAKEGSDGEEYILKRRWTEDTVFRNQNRVSQPKKRFINDVLHNDQHREFMRKYIL